MGEIGKIKFSGSNFLKRMLVVVGAVFLLFVGLQAGIYYYFQTHKTEISEQISKILSNEINGDVQFDSLDVVLYKSFPSATIELKNLSVTDSLFDKHEIKAIDIKKLFIGLNTLSLLKGAIQVNRLSLAEGKIHFFTDSADYSNLCIFRKKEDQNNQLISVDKLDINNIQVLIEDHPKNKIFDVQINQLAATVNRANDITQFNTKLNLTVAEFNFNKDRGGFLINDNVTGTLLIKLDKEKQILTLIRKPLNVNNEKIYVAGAIFKDGDITKFDLNFEAPNANFAEVRSSLSKFLATKLSVIDIEKEIVMKAHLQGKFNYPDTPVVRINCIAQDNTLTLSDNVFNNASCDFEYYNFMDSTKGHDDKNSFVAIKKFTAQWNSIPLTMVNTRIVNLITPYLTTEISSEMPTERLSQFSNGTMAFNKGSAKASFKYQGPIIETDKRSRSINGNMLLDGANITYLPNQSTFTNCKVDVVFKNDDLFLRNIVLHKNEDVISMNGYAKQFLNFYFNDPSKVAIDWTINANALHLNNYLNFFDRKYSRNKTKTTTAKNINRFSANLSQFAQQSSMHLNLNIKKLEYKKFISSLVAADVSLLENDIVLNKAKINFKKGTILATGKASTTTTNKDFELIIDAQNIDIPDLLYAFENFGQPTINNKNITGELNLKATLTGQLNSNAELIPNSLSGKLAFKLNKGSLKNFEPLQKIERFILRTRNLSNLEIRKLEGAFTLKNSKISIPLTEVSTSALTIFMQGVYGVENGTDIKILIPLRNPNKDEIKDAQGMEVDKQRGLKLYLRGIDDANGKVQFSWLKRENRPDFSK